VSGDEGAKGAVLRAFDQALMDTTDRRTKRRGGMWWVPSDLDLHFIVTRATIAIAHPPPSPTPTNKQTNKSKPLNFFHRLLTRQKKCPLKETKENQVQHSSYHIRQRRRH
jgi:hypothetical protein